MTATEVEQTETTPAVRWPLADGHRLRGTLGLYGVEWEIVCPHGTPTVGNLANAPQCRIRHDAQGWPVGLEATCSLQVGWEGVDDTFGKRNLVDADLVLADLPVAWQWPLEDALYVYPAEVDAADGLNGDRIRYAGLPPIQLRDAALQLLAERDDARAERDRARRVAVQLEQQVDQLTRLIGQTSTVVALGGHHGTAAELIRRSERIVNPFASEGPTDMADRLYAEMAALPPMWTLSPHAPWQVCTCVAIEGRHCAVGKVKPIPLDQPGVCEQCATVGACPMGEDGVPTCKTTEPTA